MKSDTDKLLEATLLLAGILAFIPLMAIYHAFVASTLWRWFAVPLFGAPPIGVLHMAGLLMIVGVVFLRLKPSAEIKPGDWFSYMASPLVILAVGWLFSFSV